MADMTPDRVLNDASRVVVLIQTTDGRQHAWEVFNHTQVTWDWIGSPGGSAHGRMVVTGEFHRMQRKNKETP